MGYRLDLDRYPTVTPADLRRTTVVDVMTCAAAMRCGESTVRAGIKRGDIPVIRTGRSLRIPTSYLLRTLGLDELADGLDEPADAATTARELTGSGREQR